MWTPSKRKGFAASPIDTAKPEACCDTFEKERSCSFPHRHSEAKGKPQTRDQTCWSIKASISWETSSKFETLTPSKTKRFAASSTDMAKPETRDETCCSKTSISCETCLILTICSQMHPPRFAGMEIRPPSVSSFSIHIFQWCDPQKTWVAHVHH